MDDLISRLSDLRSQYNLFDENEQGAYHTLTEAIAVLNGVNESAKPERLTDDDFETIRIHLSAYKERLCNQGRWNEAEEYQRIIDRFMAFASAQPDEDMIHLQKEQAYMQGWEDVRKAMEQPERKKGKWLPDNNNYIEERFICSACGRSYKVDTCMGKPMWDFCPCGADMRGEQE